MGIAVHRNNDSRACGAKTTVVGQKKVFVNGELASVLGDPNTHSGGSLNASNNDGSVYINNKPVVLLGSSASPDKLCPIPPHCGPTATSASEDVFACGGGKVEPIGSEVTYSVRTNNGSASSRRNPPSNSAPSTTDNSAYTGGAKKGEPDYVSIDKLENDPDWKRKLDEMQVKYPGLTREEIYSIVQGESSFNKRAVNPSGATGLFQFIPSTLTTINNKYGTSYTTAKIQNMSAAQQLQVYDQYLEIYNYNSNMGLGIIQAAPKYRYKQPNFEVYAPGTPAYRQNPPWRGPDGRITVQSINDYYNRFRN